MKLYTKRGSSALALLWCRRMQHFYTCFVCGGGDADFAFSETDVLSAPSEFERADSLEDLPDDHPARLKMSQIAAIVPAMP